MNFIKAFANLPVCGKEGGRNFKVRNSESGLFFPQNAIPFASTGSRYITGARSFSIGPQLRPDPVPADVSYCRLFHVTRLGE